MLLTFKTYLYIITYIKRGVKMKANNMKEIREFMNGKEVNFKANPMYIKLLNKNNDKVMKLMEKETDCTECRNYAKYISYHGINF